MWLQHSHIKCLVLGHIKCSLLPRFGPITSKDHTNEQLAVDHSNSASLLDNYLCTSCLHQCLPDPDMNFSGHSSCLKSLDGKTLNQKHVKISFELKSLLHTVNSLVFRHVSRNTHETRQQVQRHNEERQTVDVSTR